VGAAVADELLAGSGHTLEDLEAAIETTKQTTPLVLGASARIDVLARYRKDAPTENVVGVLRGTATGADEEFVVVGAHVDHVGSQAGRVLYPGANDNASGSAAVIALAESLARGPRLRRTVVFVLFASEEHGLDGARRYAEAPPFPLGRTAAMVNLDCIGRGEALQVGGGKDAPALWRLAKKHARALGVPMTEETWGGGGADATPFREAGVPIAYFAATRSYDFLHLPGDRTETLNGPLFEGAARVAWRTVLDVAEGRYSRETLPALPAAAGH
jgi:Zn-dependent M28 family amino/carboxypeptidase